MRILNQTALDSTGLPGSVADRLGDVEVWNEDWVAVGVLGARLRPARKVDAAVEEVRDEGLACLTVVLKRSLNGQTNGREPLRERAGTKERRAALSDAQPSVLR